MKWSKYNILFKSSLHGYLIYNSFSNCFLELDKDLFEDLKSIEKGELSIDSIDEDIKNELIRQRIIVSYDNEDFFDIKLKTHLTRYQKDVLGLTIAPTLKCNFNCAYCYENGVDQSAMDDYTMKSLISFIKKKTDNSKILNIAWYGGEPLLEFERIKAVTDAVKPLFKKYNAAIITNGYLMTKEKSEAFKELNINRVQVTIDGPERIHNQRRVLKNGTGTFEKILDNIENLLNVNKSIKVSVRVNIDKQNEMYYYEIYNYLKNRFKNKRLSIYPGFVKGSNSISCKSIEDCNTDHQAKADFQMKNYHQYGVTTNFFPHSKFSECTARCVNTIVVDPIGNFYKCWEDIGDNAYCIGSLNSNLIENKDVLVNYLTGEDHLENYDCINCNILSICNGGCPKDRLNKKNNNSLDTCHPMKNNVESFLDIYYQIKKDSKV
jgi:uncharacterized protein